jgi:hypothetical protein
MRQFDSAAYIDGVRAEQVKRRQMQDIPFREYVFAWSARVAWGAGSSGGALAMMVFLYLGHGVGEAVPMAILAGIAVYGVTLFWALRLRADWYDEMNITEEIKFAERRPVTTSMRDHTKVEFDLDNGRGAVVLYQPSPGAFAKWLHEVIYGGKYFSQAQAIDRGWTVDQHKQLVTQLRSIGLLHETETERNAPIITQHGAELAKKWLRMGVI